MMDISDGVSSDLPRLCAASGVGAYIEAAKLPLPTRLENPAKDAAGPTPSGALGLALDGGDDYELLFTVPRRRVARVPARIGKVTVSRIGEVTRDRRILLGSSGHDTPLVARGWDPFRRPRK
jgi:thiamine-monophosphate kinase